MIKGNGNLVPVIPAFAIQLATRVVNAGPLPGENVFQTVNRVIPHLEGVDNWEVCRAIMAIFCNTPDQLPPLKD